ncbi:hypothetical protein ABZ357_40505 [Streptomyces sp. NPDC005917]|uniref:hypothetical protein n=1 Tax=unclassified Streptomyces TaxID=2593676 RepID=UPI00340ACD45
MDEIVTICLLHLREPAPGAEALANDIVTRAQGGCEVAAQFSWERPGFECTVVEQGTAVSNAQDLWIGVGNCTRRAYLPE